MGKLEKKNMEQSAVKKAAVTLEGLAQKQDHQKVAEGITLFLKLLSNIANNPKDPKYRKIKTTNNTLKAKLFSIQGIEQLLKDLNFTFDGQEFWVYNPEDVTDISNAIIVFEARLIGLNQPQQNSEAIRQRQQEWDQNHSEDAARKAALLNSMKNDRKEKAKDFEDRPITDSVGNKLTFGCNMKTTKDVAPPPQQRG